MLRLIDRFYGHCDESFGSGRLDHALTSLNLNELADYLESYYFTIRNDSEISETDSKRWRLALSFVEDVATRISADSPSSKFAMEFRSLLQDFRFRLSILQIRCKPRPERIRSIPADVLDLLYDMLEPGSRMNPFRSVRTQWRVYCSFIMLLHLGLRRGELLILPADVVKSGYSAAESRQRDWIFVRYNPYEDDFRYSKPSIKNATAVRPLPVT
jgi:hypothetical protein